VRQKTLPLPKRGSPAHALIEFVFRLRLGEDVGTEASFVETEGPGFLNLMKGGVVEPGTTWCGNPAQLTGARSAIASRRADFAPLAMTAPAEEKFDAGVVAASKALSPRSAWRGATASGP
jgi:hypothetical protein